MRQTRQGETNKTECETNKTEGETKGKTKGMTNTSNHKTNILGRRY